MSRVREMCPSGHEYLQQTITKEKWAEAFLPQSRWGHLTSNICECINGVFVADRALPVTQLVENIRLKLAEWFVSRREDARATSAVWTKPVEDLMKEFTEEIPTMEMNVLDIESEVFEIRDKGKVYVVDLGMKGCSCGNWRDGLICRHALKAVRDTHKDLLLYMDERYSKRYYVHSYAEKIYGVDDIVPQSEDVRPPEIQAHVGRPSKNERLKKYVERKRRQYSKKLVRPKKLVRVEGENRSENQAIVDENSLQESGDLEEMEQQVVKRVKKCSICRMAGHTKTKCSQRTMVLQQEERDQDDLS
ncbi:hypothetical protein RCL1_003260 [Eukaryota sp. TZLM3-RCL]